MMVATLSQAPVVAAMQPLMLEFTDDGTVELPAGTLCDFDYHADFVVSYQIRAFFNGGLLDQAHVEQIVTHTNLDTGFSITDTPVYNIASQALLGPEERSVSYSGGVFWHLKDADGRPVTVEAGQIRYTFEEGEDGEPIVTTEYTPNLTPDAADVICPALGGHPAD
jgi:hypothetical protein